MFVKILKNRSVSLTAIILFGTVFANARPNSFNFWATSASQNALESIRPKAIPALNPRFESDEEDPLLQELAAAYYSRKYGVTEDEARRRLAIQDKAAGIEDEISGLLGADFAGIWYDANRDGRLYIGVTRAAESHTREIERIVDNYGLIGLSELVSVRFSIGELERIQGYVRSRLGNMVDRGRARTSYNPKSNSVKAKAITNLTSAEEAILREVDGLDGVDIVRVAETSLISRFDVCSITGCDAPLRGGREILGGGGCTGGFTAVYRNQPSVKLMLTAGHCIFFGGGIGTIWSAKNEAKELKEIGPADGYYLGGNSGEDEGVIRVASTSYWASTLPIGRVVVKGSSQTTFNPNYPIYSDSSSSIGQILCTTGKSTGTHCSEVWDLGVDSVAQSGGTSIKLHNMGELDSCSAKGGDSGGPIYKKNKAYGLHVSSVDSTFHCVELYQGIRAAENRLNVDIMFAE